MAHNVENSQEQHQDLRLQKMGSMAVGMVHDINNLLTVILGQGSIALLKLPPDSPARQHVEKAMAAAELAAGMTGQVLIRSGNQSEDTTDVDVNCLLEEALPLISLLVPKNVALRLQTPSPLPLVQANRVSLRQVVLNLVSNAVQAIGSQHGTITLATSLQVTWPASGAGQVSFGAPARKPCVALQVLDDGPGMDEATLQRLFEPFFTRSGQGTGLGLLIVADIADRHGAGLHVRSQPGKGAAFTLLLPALPPSPADEQLQPVH